MPKLAFLAEATCQAQIVEARQDGSLKGDNRVIRDNALPVNMSDAEDQVSDEEFSSEEEDDVGQHDEAELEAVITRLARYGPSIIVPKTVQKHQSMAALVSATRELANRFDRRFVSCRPAPQNTDDIPVSLCWFNGHPQAGSSNFLTSTRLPRNPPAWQPLISPGRAFCICSPQPLRSSPSLPGDCLSCS